MKTSRLKAVESLTTADRESDDGDERIAHTLENLTAFLNGETRPHPVKNLLSDADKQEIFASLLLIARRSDEGVSA